MRAKKLKVEIRTHVPLPQAKLYHRFLLSPLGWDKLPVSPSRQQFFEKHFHQQLEAERRQESYEKFILLVNMSYNALFVILWMLHLNLGLFSERKRRNFSFLLDLLLFETKTLPILFKTLYVSLLLKFSHVTVLT